MTETTPNPSQTLCENFLRDFTALLVKYNASFSIETYGDYDFHDAVAEVDFASEWDNDGNQTREFVNFVIPSYLDPNRNP